MRTDRRVGPSSMTSQWFGVLGLPRSPRIVRRGSYAAGSYPRSRSAVRGLPRSLPDRIHSGAPLDHSRLREPNQAPRRSASSHLEVPEWRSPRSKRLTVSRGASHPIHPYSDMMPSCRTIAPGVHEQSRCGSVASFVAGHARRRLLIRWVKSWLRARRTQQQLDG
jgi:hypothetical protein